ncbi:hypothetical protein [Bremerella alba]|uniref:Uncharacterized protein n=1 Tax=Bremerella alba TaxID=980252 RepID=A0A7V8V380_9BACT|nr:hypothetical protein [Bremerella alba]MBA2114102.1 hypothetical protein [Bremerella alba]
MPTHPTTNVNDSRYLKLLNYGIVLLLIFPALASAEKREWTMEDDETFVAECIAFDGKLMIWKSNYRDYVVSARFERFSDQDQKYLRNHYSRIFDRNAKYAASHGTKPNSAGLFDPPPVHQLGMSQASGWDQLEYFLPQFRPLTINGVPVIGDIQSMMGRKEYFRVKAKDQIGTLITYFTDRAAFKPLANKFKERGFEGTLHSGDSEQQQETFKTYQVFNSLYEYFHLKSHKEAVAKITTDTRNDFERGTQTAQKIDMYEKHLVQIDTPQKLRLTIVENVDLKTYDFDRQCFPLRHSDRDILVRGASRYSMPMSFVKTNPWKKPETIEVDIARARDISSQLDGKRVVLKYDFILSNFRSAAIDNPQKPGLEPTVTAELSGLSLVHTDDPYATVYRWNVKDLEVSEQ